MSAISILIKKNILYIMDIIINLDNIGIVEKMEIKLKKWLPIYNIVLKPSIEYSQNVIVRNDIIICSWNLRNKCTFKLWLHDAYY